MKPSTKHLTTIAVGFFLAFLGLIGFVTIAFAAAASHALTATFVFLAGCLIALVGVYNYDNTVNNWEL